MHFQILSQLCTLCLFEFYFLCLGKGNDKNACLVGTLGELHETEDVTIMRSYS